MLRGLPLLFNQLLLSAGQVLMNQIYSNRGLEAVASMNIVTTVANLFVVIMWSFGNYIAIYTGNLLGNREFDKARGECPKLMALSFVCCIAGSILLAAISGLIPRLYNVLPLVRTQATQKHRAFVHSRRLAAGEVHCIYPAGGVPAGQLS